MKTRCGGARTIPDLASLKAHLQLAVQVEWTTIPAYLCAEWSLVQGENVEAAAVLHSVVMEEMLHMALAANVLIALGGEPRIAHAEVVPQYPTYLPFSADLFTVDLAPFSRETVETFVRIERPARPDAPPELDHYRTLGQFYAAIEAGLREFCAEPAVWSGRPERQLPARYYYNGGGEVVPVTDLESALLALEEIVDQGEGLRPEIWDGDAALFGQRPEPAHFFRFHELLVGRRYTAADTPRSGPSGAPLFIDWDAVHPMRANPCAQQYAPGSPVRRMLDRFNDTYTRLLRHLQAAFEGAPEQMIAATSLMKELRYQGVALMHVPTGDPDGSTVGPPFEFRG